MSKTYSQKQLADIERGKRTETYKKRVEKRLPHEVKTPNYDNYVAQIFAPALPGFNL